MNIPPVILRGLTLVGLALALAGFGRAQVLDDAVTVPVQFQGLYNADNTGDAQNPASISITPNGTNFAIGTMSGTNQATTNAVARLRPGRTYTFTISTHAVRHVWVKITPATGYRVFINNVEHELFEWAHGDNSTLEPLGAFTVRLDDGGGGAVGAAGSLRPGRVLWSVGLGQLQNGKPAGSIVLAEDGLTANTFRPQALWYDRDNGAAIGMGDDGEVVFVKVAGVLRQVYAATALADIQAETDHSYYIRYYRREDVSSPQNADGTFPIVPGAQPLFEFKVENPDYPAISALRITKTTNQSGTLSMWTEMRQQTGRPVGETQWMVQDWVEKPASANTVTSPVRHRWTYTNSDRDELFEILGTSDSPVIHQVMKHYDDINFVMETARELAYEIVGDGASALRTDYTYHTNPTVTLGGWHRVKSIVANDGTWAAFDYDDDYWARGQIRQIRKPHKNSPTADAGFDATSGEVTTFWYAFVDNYGTKKLPTKIETRIDNNITARSEFSYAYEQVTDYSSAYTPSTNAEMTLRVATRKDYFGSGTNDYLTTITRMYREDADPQYRFFTGLPHSVEKPDKTMTAMAYFRADFLANAPFNPSTTGGARVHVALVGTADPTGTTLFTSYSGAQALPGNFHIVAGKSSESRVLFGEAGLPVISDQRIYYDGNWTTVREDWSNYTNSIWPHQVQRRTGASGSFWDVVNHTWTQGRLSQTVDDSGVTRSVIYDSVGRVDSVTRTSASATVASVAISIAAQKVTNVYDAAGQVLTQSITATGSSESLVTSRTYDKAGRTLSETIPGGGTTTYDYGSPAARTVTATLPTGANRIETRYLDGRVAWLAGSAGVPQYYDYSVDSAGVRYARINVRTPGDVRKRESWSDWLGRPRSTRRPGFTGQSAYNFIETMTYEAGTGRLEKVQRTGYADTLYAYNVMSEVSRTGIDVSGGGLQYNSSDRITESDTSFEWHDDAYWITTLTSTYPFSNSTPLVVRTARRRLTGLTSMLRGETRTLDVDNIDTRRSVLVVAATALATIATTTSGMTQAAEEHYLNGLPVASRGFDGLVFRRGYDPLTRATSVTDPRTGAVNTTYKSNTALAHETTDAAGKRLSRFDYDTAGRPTIVTDALGKTIRRSYSLRGEVEYQWGSAGYPVSYVYDDYGQRTHLRTYQDAAGSISNWDTATWPQPGSYSDTEWQYDGPSGQLVKKLDARGKFTEYSYNVRGQTAQRFWSRLNSSGQRVTTTYHYSGDGSGEPQTGELLSISYNDGTPGITYAYTRTGQLHSVDQNATQDGTGYREFGYDPTQPYRLDTVDMGGFYAGRVLTRQYDGIKRPNGFYLGTVAAGLSSDLTQTYSFNGLGRFDYLDSLRGTSASRRFTYGYTTNSSLVASLTSGSFAVARTYDSNRDLLTNIQSSWGATVRTSYAYRYNDRRERRDVVQSGDAFADYGGTDSGAIHQIFRYNDRGEVIEGSTYLGSDPASVSTMLSGRKHEFTYDAIGNRKSANTSGDPAIRDDYQPDVLNQYASRENHTIAIGGTADAAARVTARITDLAGRAGRHWGDNVTVANNGHPFAGPITIYTGKAGAASGGADLIRPETREVEMPASMQSFSYDDDGNLTSDGVWNYFWDAENRLVRMTTVNGLGSFGFPNRMLEFKYDYLGRRVQKRSLNMTASPVKDVYRRYLYDGDNLVAEFAATATSCGTLLRSFTWGLDMAGSLSATGGVGALVQITDHGNGRSYFPTYDGNGNIASLLQAEDGGGINAGTAVAKYEYSPFGELLRCEGTYAKENPFRFSTKFTDDESGLVYYGARYFSASLGRFINRDPIAEQGGLNLYGFCGNDGINGYDYLGYSWKSFWKKVGNVFSGAGKVLKAAGNAIVQAVAIVAAVAAIVITAIYAPYVGLELISFATNVAMVTYGATAISGGVIKSGVLRGRGGYGPSGTRSSLIMNWSEEGWQTWSDAAIAAQWGLADLQSRLLEAVMTPIRLIDDLTNATVETLVPGPMGDGVKRLMILVPIPGKKLRKIEQGAMAVEEALAARKAAIAAEQAAARGGPAVVHAAETAIPRGFASAEQFNQAAAELRRALAKSGIEGASIGVRGSSVTGVSYRTGRPFGPASDIDFFIESGELTKGLKTSPNIPGFVHPKSIHANFDPIAEWAEIWSENLGRKVSVGGFELGAVPAGPVIRP